VADLPRQRRRRLSQSIAVVVALIVGIGIVDAAVWTDVNARTQSQHEEAALAMGASVRARPANKVALRERTPARALARELVFTGRSILEDR